MVPTRLGLVRLRRGGSDQQPLPLVAALAAPSAASASASSVAGVSSVRLLAPPEVSVRQAVLARRRRRGSNPSPPQGRTCCGRGERQRAQ